MVVDCGTHCANIEGMETKDLNALAASVATAKERMDEIVRASNETTCLVNRFLGVQPSEKGEQ